MRRKIPPFGRKYFVLESGSQKEKIFFPPLKSCAQIRHLESVLVVPSNLPLKFGQNQVSSSQRWKKYFSFCEPYCKANYFLSIFNYFYKHLSQNVACLWIELLLSPMFCLNLTILNSFAEKKLLFFILFQIFSAKPGFLEYFLRTRFAESTTFSTSDHRF